jgi:hypothetical protein
MTQVEFSRKRNLRPLVASAFGCDRLDTSRSPAQSCAKHNALHIALVFLGNRTRCREH